MSRDNLLAYLALRENDLHTLQNQLAEEGLSSLGRLEANVITHLEKVLEHLGVKEKSPRGYPSTSFSRCSPIVQ